jgi:hypothetical protein
MLNAGTHIPKARVCLMTNSGEMAKFSVTAEFLKCFLSLPEHSGEAKHIDGNERKRESSITRRTKKNVNLKTVLKSSQLIKVKVEDLNIVRYPKLNFI